MKRTGSIVILYFKMRKNEPLPFLKTKAKKLKGSIVNYQSFAIPMGYYATNNICTHNCTYAMSIIFWSTYGEGILQDFSTLISHCSSKCCLDANSFSFMFLSWYCLIKMAKENLPTRQFNRTDRLIPRSFRSPSFVWLYLFNIYSNIK